MNLNKKLFCAIAILICCVQNFSAQVGINTSTPHTSAALDIQSPNNNQGVLLPRMTTSQKNAITSPASGLLVYDTNLKCISQNAGTSAAPVWVCLRTLELHTKSFYMPSIAVDASVTATNKTLNLYDEYKKQFSAPAAKSDTAPTSLPYFQSASDLYYYVTDYDKDVLKITKISDTGVVTYDVIKAATYNSFMNVVFVVK